MGKRYAILKNPIGPVAKRTEIELPAEEMLRKSLSKIRLSKAEILLRKGLAHSNEILDHAKEALNAIGAEKNFREADKIELKEIIEELNGLIGYIKEKLEEGQLDKQAASSAVEEGKKDKIIEEHLGKIAKLLRKGKISHTEAYEAVKDKPGVKDPRALAQHIVEQAGGEKMTKHPGHPDQSVHSPTGGQGSGRKPEGGRTEERPQSRRTTWELQSMRNALCGIKFFNTPEEDKRLKEVEEELKYRSRKQ